MEENKSLFGLQVDRNMADHLNNASRWARFLSIVVFIGIGLMALLMIAVGDTIATSLSEWVPMMDSTSAAGLLIGILLLICAIVVLLFYFLIKAANNIRKGLQLRNQQLFNSGLASLKTYFMMYGIISALALVFNLIELF